MGGWRAFAVASLLSFRLVACSWQPAPPPQFDYADFGGTGDLMTKCMQYGSQSYCERQIWGGGGNGLR